MPGAVVAYVRYVDAASYRVGRLAMYMIFAMMGLLLFSAIARSLFETSFIWIVEMAQFMMAAYYILGGGYSMQLDSHVRMDLLYSRWTVRKRAFADSITSFCLIFYLVFLTFGGFSGTLYAIEYGQKNYSSWAPYVWPIKVIMTFGIVLMLLQAVATFFKDLATYLGRPIDTPYPPSRESNEGPNPA